MAGLKQFLNRTFFWSYERGAWQYDVAVVLILIFVLLTPRRWFQDQPQVGIPDASERVQLILFSDGGHRQEYRVDWELFCSDPVEIEQQHCDRIGEPVLFLLRINPGDPINHPLHWSEHGRQEIPLAGEHPRHVFPKRHGDCRDDGAEYGDLDESICGHD